MEAAGVVLGQAIDAWPFGPEWLSGIFDYNVAPFFQSFVEVRWNGPPIKCESSLMAYMAALHGARSVFGGPSNSRLADRDFVEWIVPYGPLGRFKSV